MFPLLFLLEVCSGKQLEREYSYFVQNESILHFTSLTGSVEIEGSETDTVLIKEILTHRSVVPDNIPGSTLIPSGLSLDFIPSRINAKGVRVSYKIIVPEDFSIQINEMVGSLLITRLKGNCEVLSPGSDLVFNQIVGNLNIFNGGGETVIENILGNVSCKSNGGFIGIEKLTGTTEIFMGGGDIFVETLNGDLDIESISGDITIRHIASELLEISSGGGSIDIKGMSGDIINLISEGGSIVLENIEGNITAQTNSGKIHGQAIYGNVTCSNSGGEVEIDSIRGTVDCTTIDGDIKVTNYQPLATEFGISKMQTSRGNIFLVIQSEYAEVNATTSFGKIVSEFKGESSFNQRHLLIHHAEAKMKINISTISGDIYLNKGE